jgi:hypothetical protein
LHQIQGHELLIVADVGSATPEVSE